MAGRHDLPEVDPFTRTYWDAAAEGRLLIRRCGACGHAHHYPREFCPHCWSEDVTWERASGRATLYTWSVVHRNDLPPFTHRTPYVAAVVDLVEGPRMMTEIVTAGEAELPPGTEPVGQPAAGTEVEGGPVTVTELEGGLRAGTELEVVFREGVPVFRVRGHA
ncbi:Zn-ribbon domain-containing OB-fold protein [Streptomyces bullii]|uniref:Zn-ribbon domain-containing OB-fold protein n=1 Tax=Streptomyces bullii TaxID=349910 RepID=A0ABW0UUE4_9ACTN